MPTPLLTAKLYISPPRLNQMPRPRLIERLNAGLHRRLTLISAPAGFGETAFVTEWLNSTRTSLPGSPLTRTTTTRCDSSSLDSGRFRV